LPRITRFTPSPRGSRTHAHGAFSPFTVSAFSASHVLRTSRRVTPRSPHLSAFWLVRLWRSSHSGHFVRLLVWTLRRALAWFTLVCVPICVLRVGFINVTYSLAVVPHVWFALRFTRTGCVYTRTCFHFYATSQLFGHLVPHSSRISFTRFGLHRSHCFTLLRSVGYLHTFHLCGHLIHIVAVCGFGVYTRCLRAQDSRTASHLLPSPFFCPHASSLHTFIAVCYGFGLPTSHTFSSRLTFGSLSCMVLTYICSFIAFTSRAWTRHTLPFMFYFVLHGCIILYNTVFGCLFCTVIMVSGSHLWFTSGWVTWFTLTLRSLPRSLRLNALAHVSFAFLWFARSHTAHCPFRFTTSHIRTVLCLFLPFTPLHSRCGSLSAYFTVCFPRLRTRLPLNSRSGSRFHTTAVWLPRAAHLCTHRVSVPLPHVRLRFAVRYGWFVL